MSASIIAPYDPAIYDVRSTTRIPASGPDPVAERDTSVIEALRTLFPAPASRGDEAGDQLAVVLSVAVHHLEALGALEVQMQVVLPGEADAAVGLDRLAAHAPRRLADVGLGDRCRHRGVLGAGLQGP